jgi:hypothetical protein
MVGRGDPFQFTTEVGKKFVPFTCNMTLAGAQLCIEVAGGVDVDPDTETELMFGGCCWAIVNGTWADGPPPGPGVKIRIFAVPAAERRLVGIVVVRLAGLPVVLLGVEVYSVGSEVMAVPTTHCTTEHAEKLVVGDCLASISRPMAELPAGAVVGFGDCGIFGVTFGFPA